jgi:hypothetical protein
MLMRGIWVVAGALAEAERVELQPMRLRRASRRAKGSRERNIRSGRGMGTGENEAEGGGQCKSQSSNGAIPQHKR